MPPPPPPPVPPPPRPVTVTVTVTKKAESNKSKKAWRPFIAAKCCSIEEQQTTRRSVFLRNFSLSRPCRPTRSQFCTSSTRLVAELPSFRRLSFSDLSSSSTCSSTRINKHSGGFGFGASLHVFQLSELRAITQNFSSNFLLGEGGFGTVHKGYMDENLVQGMKAQAVAVKLLDIQGLQGHREWLAEVIFLGQLQHPHLVKLIGYCSENEERLLVYEFMPRGSLENHLFKRLSVGLAWGTRLKIAIGAAKGLAFLHAGAEQPVIYRDFKTSNILLDSDFTAKLSDFGLAKMGPEGSDTHVTTRVMGTYGYAAPEYVNTGHLTIKSDVYSFGVVLLELLSGRRSMDKTKPKSEQNLVDWARPYLTSSRRLRCIMDPKLGGQYSMKGARAMATLALQCVSLNPKARPKMSFVIELLQGLQNLRDMAAVTTCGQRPIVTKSIKNNTKGRREGYKKPSTNFLDFS